MQKNRPKTIYLIPGFNQNHKLKSYRELSKIFKSKNFKVIPVSINWERKTMSDYVDQFLFQLKPDSKSDIYFLGFSFGAMIAFIAATKVSPKQLFLCSLSPYFNEDLKYLKKSWTDFVGSKRIKHFKTLSFNKLAPDINTKTILLAGEKEPIQLLNRVNQAYKKLNNSELVLISNTKHDLADQRYLEQIKAIIS